LLRSVRFWVGLAVSLVFLLLFFRSVPWDKVASAFSGANYAWILPAVAVYLVSLLVRSFRYRYLVLDLVDVPATRLFPVICIAFMANNLVPARAGELVRAYVMGEKFGISKVSALGTVVVERLFDGLTLLIFLLVTVATLGSNGTLRTLALLSLIVFVAALAVFAAILRWPKRSEALLHRTVELAPARARPLARTLITSLLDGMVALRHPHVLMVVLITSPLAWLMEAVVFLMVGRAFGIDLNLGWFMMAMAAGNLALTVPSSQGGIGPFEFFVKQVLLFAGVAEGTAAAYALAVHAVIIVPVTVLGLIYLSVINVSLSRALKGGSEIEKDAADVSYAKG
jgi:uncharacterized protein (TIRG00374 family)